MYAYNPTVTGGMSFGHGDPNQIYLFTVGQSDAVTRLTPTGAFISKLYGTPYGNGSYPTVRR